MDPIKFLLKKYCLISEKLTTRTRKSELTSEGIVWKVENIFFLNYLVFMDVFIVKNNIQEKLFLYKTRQTC